MPNPGHPIVPTYGPPWSGYVVDRPETMLDQGDLITSQNFTIRNN